MTKLFATEAQEQMAFIEWADMYKITLYNPYYGLLKAETRYFISEFLFHIANGELRDKVIATKLKKMGVMAGVADLFLMLATPAYHGMFIEMKSRSKPSKLSKSQLAFAQKSKDQGYWYVVARGWEEARDLTLEYLGTK